MLRILQLKKLVSRIYFRRLCWLETLHISIRLDIGLENKREFFFLFMIAQAEICEFINQANKIQKKHQKHFFSFKELRFGGKQITMHESNHKMNFMNWKYFSSRTNFASHQIQDVIFMNLECTLKHKAKVLPSPEFKVCLLPPARKPTHTNVAWGKRDWRLFCLNWIGKKIFIELFVKRKYLLPGFVSEKWFFICRIFHPSTLLLILNPQSKIERQSDKGEGEKDLLLKRGIYLLFVNTISVLAQSEGEEVVLDTSIFLEIKFQNFA